MDANHCMIVDLEKRGDKEMFVTERVSSIYQNKNGLWAVRFSSSPRVFNYNPSRLLYLTHPDTINLGEKGLYINNKHINNVAELLRFTDGRYIFYRVTRSILPVPRLTKMEVLFGIIFVNWLLKQD